MGISLIGLLIAFIVLAIVCWIISLIPLPAPMQPFRSVMYIIVALIAIVYLLNDFGVFGGTFGGHGPYIGR